MDLDYVVIGNRIREARIKKKWTQAVLAERANVETSYISHIERAVTKLSLPTLINLANALDTTLDELVYGNLTKSAHVSTQIINELLSDCSPDELRAIAEMIKTTKSVLRTMK